jgi:DNA-binding CsgD family transcriptional regulator
MQIVHARVPATSRAALHPVWVDNLLSSSDALGLAVVIVDSVTSVPLLSAEARSVASSPAGEAVIERAFALARRAAEQSTSLTITSAEHQVGISTRGGCATLRVRTVRRGTASIVAVVIEGRFESFRESPTLTGLTARERDVASLLAVGHSNKEIATRLGISVHTARHHTERVFTKLGVRTRAAAVAAIGCMP